MSFNIKTHENELLFVPIGGAHKIGANMYAYHFKGKILIIDCGCGFTDDGMPGIDITVPDISFLIQNKKNIVGIVITHAHEDHIGALKYLWHELGCKLYATPFVNALLTERFIEARYEHPAEMCIIEPKNPRFNLGPFDIELVPLCHSIPEMQAVMLRTEAGNVFHTGDWKYDDAPLVGKQNNDGMLERLGSEGILALTGDSTNVFNPGHSGSEGELRESLIKLISGCKKMALLTTFSSNIARMESVIEAAAACGRKIVLSGRNLRRIFKAGIDSGYLQNIKKVEFVEEHHVNKHDRNKLLVIATGCQGEPFASLTKMSKKEHKFINLEAGDSVIFSSKVIPGNDAKIYRIFGRLIELGLHIMMEATDFTHVSGHPGQRELKRLYDLLRPQILIPVHGEEIHLYYHTRLAREWGIKTVLQVTNGDVVKLTQPAKNQLAKAEKIGKVHTGALGVYGNEFYDYDSAVMKARRRMRDDGVCFIVLLLSGKYELKAKPIVRFPGFLDETSESEFIKHIQDEIAWLIEDEYERKFKGKRPADIKHKDGLTNLEKLVQTRVKSILKHEIDRAPPIYMEVSVWE